VTRKNLALLAIAVAIPFGLVACGGDDESDTTTAASDTSTESSTTESTTASGGGGGSVDISETEFALDPADSTVGAGSVTLTATNDGSIDHNLEIEGNGIEEVTDTLAPGDSGKLAVDLEPGTYELYCSIDSHKDQGMEGELTVE
jgi:plastocyanin